MTTEDKLMYAIAGIVVLAVLVSVSWAVYVALAGSPLEAATEAALAATAQPTQPPQPTASPLPVHTTQTPKPVEATPTPVPPTLLPTHTPQPTAALPTQTPSPQRTLYRVVEAFAGDTVKVSRAAKTYLICYAGIDAPDPATMIGCLATQANRHFAKGKTVYLEKDTSETDPSGCLVRHVFQEDGTLISAKLVYFGYAVVRTDSPDTRYRDLLLQAQQKAKEAGRGLWGSMPVSAAVAPTPVPPTPTMVTQPTATLLPRTETLVPSATPLLPTPTPEPVTATPTLAALTPTPTLPAESAKVVVDAGCSQFDAPGDDNYNKENEWVCFANVGGQPADMTDWVLRDEEGWRYTFPAFSLGPGQTVRVHTGCGANTAMDVYWCKGGATAVWNNEGDTVFLLDAAGNLVAQYSYPGS